MTVIIPHHKTRQEVVNTLDSAVTQLFQHPQMGSVEIVDPKKEWSDSTMTFSVTGKMGFIKVPLSGTVAVDDQNVTVTCDLPSMVKNFVGEDKVRAGITEKVTELIQA
jgi:hypothetical protein